MYLCRQQYQVNRVCMNDILNLYAAQHTKVLRCFIWYIQSWNSTYFKFVCTFTVGWLYKLINYALNPSVFDISATFPFINRECREVFTWRFNSEVRIMHAYIIYSRTHLLTFNACFITVWTSSHGLYNVALLHSLCSELNVDHHQLMLS